MIGRYPRNDHIGFFRITRPVDMTASSLHRGFKFQQVGIEVAQHSLFERPACLTKFLPIWHFADDLRAFGANGVGCLVQIAA